ncbi:MAG: hypothetical protein LBP56_05330 [Odoribacteraceae bacterium]|nr:hypothetical protein [Odoribacteraceae bacterium]
MKTRIYTTAWAAILIASACSSTSNFARAIEDDIYYVPGEHSLYVQELEQQTGQAIDPSILQNHNNTPLYNGENENRDNVNTNSHAIGMARYATQQQVDEAEASNPGTIDVITPPEDDGYWMSGFNGSEYDLRECVRIMNLYPEGFALFGNGYEIALTLSFSPDWNVYTLNNRYWWFPTSSNINLYPKFLFGTYPTYAMTMIWNNPRFDSYAFSNLYDFRFGVSGRYWSVGWSWGYYDPWYYNSWYYSPWYHDHYYYRYHDHYYRYHHHYHDWEYYHHYRDHRPYYAGSRSNYVSRHVYTGRRDSYYNSRTNYSHANRSRSSHVNSQSTNARSNYNRNNAVNQGDNSRSGTSSYTRNQHDSRIINGNTSSSTRNTPAQGTSGNNNSRSHYTRSSSTSTSSSGTTSRSTNTSSSSRQSTSSSSSSGSSRSNSSSNSRSTTPAGGSSSSSYSRSSGSSSSGSSSRSSSRSSGSSSSSSSRSNTRR